MKMDEVQKLHSARPYQPFAIHTAEGRKFPIPHPEFLAFDPEGTTLVAFRPGHSFSVLDVNLVTELEMLPANGKSRHRRSK